MNNPIMRRFEVTSAYRPLSDRRMVASATISCPPDNAQSVLFLGDDGSDVPWVPGEWHDFWNVDLNEIMVKGTPGDIVTVVGGTW